MTNLNIAKLYLANNTNATATQIDTAVTDGTALTAINALTTAQFVEAAYQAAFGRAADAEGLAYWSDQIDNQGMAADDAFMTALNYGATVYVAPTVDAPLVIGTETFTAATVSATDDVAVAANKAAADTAAAAISAGEAAVIVATVTEVATTVTAASDAVAAVIAASAPDAVVTKALTAGIDNFQSGTANDIFDASALNTLGSSDTIIDSSTTDADVLNVTVNATPGAFTATNIETINVNWNAISVATLDLSKVDNATVNVDSTTLGFQDVTINNSNSNNIAVDGTTIGTLAVNAVKLSSIDSGAAANVTLTGAATAITGFLDTATLTINNDITALNADTAIDVLNLKSTADVTATLTDAAGIDAQDKIVVQGDKSLTIVNTAAVDLAVTSVLQNELTAGTLTLKSSGVGAQDTTKIDADLIILTAATGAAITVKDGQEFQLAIDQGAATSFTGTGVVNVDAELKTSQTALDVTAVTSMDFTVNNAGLTTTTLLTTDADTAVTYSGTGANNVTSTGVASIDASASTGTFTYTNSVATEVQGVAGSATAANTITFINTTANAAFTGGSVSDTIDATALTTGRLTANLGAGDDRVDVTSGFIAGGTLTIDGGAGNDTLQTALATDFSVTTLSLTSIENLNVTTASTFAGYQLDAATYNVAGQALNSNIIVTSHATKDLNGSTDLSALVLSTNAASNIATTTLNGLDGSADTFIGTDIADTFDMGTGADTITTGAGSDIITIVDADSVESAMDKVTDFDIAKDTLNFSTNAGVTAAIAIGAAVDVKGAVNDGTGAEDIRAIVTTGVISLVGNDADDINTLAEWIDVAETATVVAVTDQAAFEYGGNTYVYSTDGADVVELTGLTGITALGLAVAANTLVIA